MLTVPQTKTPNLEDGNVHKDDQFYFMWWDFLGVGGE